MSIKDGEKIAIEFSEDIIGDVSDNVSAFSVSFSEYLYEPDGEIVTSERRPVRLERHSDEINTNVDISHGIFSNVKYENGALVLNGANEGFAEIDIPDIRSVRNYETSRITWDADIPSGGSIRVEARSGNGEYLNCSNGGEIPGLVPGMGYDGATLTIKVALSSGDPEITPELNSLSLYIKSFADSKTITLIFAPGNKNSFQNAIGTILVNYSNGTLSGSGGPVNSFRQGFTPSGLESKYDKSASEHVECTVDASGKLIHVNDL